jgi:hypothetical protein
MKENRFVRKLKFIRIEQVVSHPSLNVGSTQIPSTIRFEVSKITQVELCQNLLVIIWIHFAFSEVSDDSLMDFNNIYSKISVVLLYFFC